MKFKPRILIPITVQFSVRYMLRTGLLNKIQEYAQPVIVLGWRDFELEREIKESGIDVFRLPEKEIGIRYERILKQLTLHQLRKINTPTTSIDYRRNMSFLSTGMRLRCSIRDIFFSIITSVPYYQKSLIARQNTMVVRDTNISQYFRLFEQINPDLVFCLTPYFIEEELLLRATAARKIPVCTSILSFDNLTTRGYLPIPFDEYYLWNQYNVDELARIYPETTDKVVKIVGAPQFDFYYDPSYIWAKEKWLKYLNLPEERPVILFGSASKMIAPQEEQWLMDLDDAIESGEIIKKPVILFRRHPNEGMERWDEIRRRSRHVYFDEPWIGGKERLGKTNITRHDLEKLVSTLYYCQVHINASSTMTVDGAIFDRPQIGPAYDETGKTDRFAKEIYLREHYLPITRSGGLEIVYSRKELIRASNNAFQDPSRLSEGRKKLVREICTFPDGLCTERVDQALSMFVEKHIS